MYSISSLFKTLKCKSCVDKYLLEGGTNKKPTMVKTTSTRLAQVQALKNSSPKIKWCVYSWSTIS